MLEKSPSRWRVVLSTSSAEGSEGLPSELSGYIPSRTRKGFLAIRRWSGPSQGFELLVNLLTRSLVYGC